MGRDMVKWGFRQWTMYVHMHSKEELQRAHEAIHKEHVHRRVRTALERRLATSTRDMVKWGFRQWRQMMFHDFQRELIDECDSLQEESRKMRFGVFLNCRIHAND